jgi:phosphatidylglycerophosphate synthase
MFDTRLRQLKDQVFIPIATETGKHLSPTSVSVIGLGVGIACGVAAWQGAYALALLLWIINRALDGLDGSVARATNRQSELGGYLDILIDHAVYALIPLMLMLGAPTQANLFAGAFLLGAFYVNAASWMFLSSILERRSLGAQARGERTTVVIPTGLIEGAETVLLYALFFLLPGWLALLFGLMGTLVLFTTVQRLLWAFTVLD